MLKLEPLLRFSNGVIIHSIGKTPFGDRTTYVIGEGRFEGPRLKGRILPGGGDWLLRGTGGLSKLDVRKTFETDDGAMIDVRYVGLYRFSDEVTTKLSGGGASEFGDTLFQVQAQFETGDQRYAWLNEVLAIGEGRETQSGVDYQLYSIVRG
ncbi:MAG: DUF3237 domain-containing protein [Planctomycetia bacterium]|jgi:hypothetical protein|nr:DUF3237 domain-containing protein [Planctomycetia bacterium]